MSTRPSSTSPQSRQQFRAPLTAPRSSNLFLKADCNARLWWHRRDDRWVTVFRPLPVKDAVEEKWAPLRAADGGFPWIRRYLVVRGLGPAKLSFVVFDPEDPTADWHLDASRNMNPVALLVQRIGAAIAAGAQKPSWNYRTPLQRRGTADPQALWLGISESYLVQGLIAQSGFAPYRTLHGLDDSQKLPVLDLDGSTGVELIRRLEDQSPSEIVGLRRGTFLRLQRRSRFECGVDFTDTCGMLKPSLESAVSAVWKKVYRWSELVHVPTVEEQIRLIIEARIQPSAIVYALEEAYGELLPREILEAAAQENKRSTVSLATPAAVRTRSTSAPEPRGLVEETLMPSTTAVPFPEDRTAWSAAVSPDEEDLNLSEEEAAPPPADDFVDVPAELQPAHPVKPSQSLEGQPAFTSDARLRRAKEALARVRARHSPTPPNLSESGSME